jgi:flagellar basal-body rod modification protein FlgD
MSQFSTSGDFSYLNPAPRSIDEVSEQASMQKDQFLQLLIAQISNQDPLNPIDDKELITQMAQFTHIEQAIQGNKYLDNIEKALSNQSSLSLAQIIGKKTTVNSENTVLTDESQSSWFFYHLNESARNIKAEIKDSEGHTVREYDLGPQIAGDHSIQWDGRNNGGYFAGKGNYKIHFYAQNHQNQAINVDTEKEGIVQQIIYQDGKPVGVYIDQYLIRPENITRISQT